MTTIGFWFLALAVCLTLTCFSSNTQPDNLAHPIPDASEAKGLKAVFGWWLAVFVLYAFCTLFN